MQGKAKPTGVEQNKIAHSVSRNWRQPTGRKKTKFTVGRAQLQLRQKIFLDVRQ